MASARAPEPPAAAGMRSCRQHPEIETSTQRRHGQNLRFVPTVRARKLRHLAQRPHHFRLDFTPEIRADVESMICRAPACGTSHLQREARTALETFERGGCI